MRAVVLIVLALAACGSLQEREQASCARMGFEPGDAGFWNCMDMMEREQDRNVASGAAMLGMSQMLLAPRPSMDVYVH